MIWCVTLRTLGDNAYRPQASPVQFRGGQDCFTKRQDKLTLSFSLTDANLDVMLDYGIVDLLLNAVVTFMKVGCSHNSLRVDRIPADYCLLISVSQVYQHFLI